MNVNEFLTKMVQSGGSDAHLKVGKPPGVRINGIIQPQGSEPLRPEHTESIARVLLDDEKWKMQNGKCKKKPTTHGLVIHFSFSIFHFSFDDPVPSCPPLLHALIYERLLIYSDVMARAKETNGCDDFIHEDKVRIARSGLVDTESAVDLARTFQALADPTRARIISALLETELCVCDLAALLDVSQSAVSHQLKQMRDQRLVKARKEGRIVYYMLDDDHIRDLFTRGLEHLDHG